MTAQPMHPARPLTRWVALVAVVIAFVGSVGVSPAHAEHQDPTFQPLNPVMVLNADLSLGVTWDAPEREATTPATGYTLVLAENPTNRQWWIDVGPDVRSHTWDASLLVPGLSYDTAIWAMNANHLTTAVETNRITMPGGATAPSAPSNASATQTGVDTVTVAWDVPSDDGGEPVSTYEVDTDGAFSGDVTASTHSMVVGGLAPGTYEFGIVAVNSVGTSVRATATVTVLATVAGAPGRPSNVTAVQTGPGEVTISWDAPADEGDSPITSYDVGLATCCYGDGYPEPSTARSAVFDDLVLGTEYTLSVAALNAIGTGPRAFQTVTITRWGPPTVARPAAVSPGEVAAAGAAAPGTLAATGSRLGGFALVGLLMLVAGGALMTWSRRLQS